MSLTEKIVEELYSLPSGRTCCNKAFLCGLLYGCQKNQDQRGYTSSFYRQNDAQRVAQLLDLRFSSGGQTEITQMARGGHRAYAVEVRSKSLCGVFDAIDNKDVGELSEFIGFRCEECAQKFLGGVFISSAVMSNPKSGYHLEFAVLGEKRARLLSDLLEENIHKPSMISRPNKIGLYYKSNTKISDLLYFIGATKSSFVVTNFSIERDIRNNENRATNCVTRNISRSVDATRKQIEAIELLMERQKITALGEELEYTARLRLENDSATLSELAMLHRPPISKSGLNSRLRKILSAAEDIDKNGEM